MRVKFQVFRKSWVRCWLKSVPHRHRKPWTAEAEAEAEELVDTYAWELAEYRYKLEDHLRVVELFAEALPNLKKMWLWGKVHPVREHDHCNMAYESCRRVNLLWSFRFPWYIHRTEKGIVYAMGLKFDHPHPFIQPKELNPFETEDEADGIHTGIFYDPDEWRDFRDLDPPLDDPHPDLSLIA